MQGQRRGVEDAEEGKEGLENLCTEMWARRGAGGCRADGCGCFEPVPPVRVSYWPYLLKANPALKTYVFTPSFSSSSHFSVAGS